MSSPPLSAFAFPPLAQAAEGDGKRQGAKGNAKGRRERRERTSTASKPPRGVSAYCPLHRAPSQRHCVGNHPKREHSWSSVPGASYRMLRSGNAGAWPGLPSRDRLAGDADQIVQQAAGPAPAAVHPPCPVQTMSIVSVASCVLSERIAALFWSGMGIEERGRRFEPAVLQELMMSPTKSTPSIEERERPGVWPGTGNAFTVLPPAHGDGLRPGERRGRLDGRVGASPAPAPWCANPSGATCRRPGDVGCARGAMAPGRERRARDSD